jgi:23S rRNA pseudouridine1911/1915/1917 synthase
MEQWNIRTRNMSLQVIYEDNHLIAVNKPAGMLVQADETGDTPLSEHVKDYIKARYDKPGAVYLGTIHRIDRPVSGAVLFARTDKALTRMNKLFQEQKIQKTYLAITLQCPKPEFGTLKHYLMKDSDRNIAKVFDAPSNRNAGAKESVLEYELRAQIGDHHLIEVRPHTGRPHQIRAQLAKIGCPIRGDVKYGYPQTNRDASINLHCRAMSFIHPVKNEPVTIQADTPNDQIWGMFQGF